MVAHHFIYQLANLFLAAAFIIPDNYRHHNKLFRSLIFDYTGATERNKMQSETADFAPGAATWRSRPNITS